MNELTDYIANHPVTIKSGKHDSPECGMCILEMCSLALGIEWTDSPDLVGLPDIRALNDAKWPDNKTRTREMLRLGVAVWPWRTATDEQRVLFVRRLSELTIRRVLPPILRNVGLHAEADRCERDGTETSARDAARAASYASYASYADVYASYADVYASYAASYAANAASYATAAASYATDADVYASYAASYASYAASYASYAASTETLITAVDCWVEAASELTEKAA